MLKQCATTDVRESLALHQHLICQERDCTGLTQEPHDQPILGYPKAKPMSCCFPNAIHFWALKVTLFIGSVGFGNDSTIPSVHWKLRPPGFCLVLLEEPPLKPIQVRSYRSNDSGCLWKEISSQVQLKWPVSSVFVISGWRIQQENRAPIDPHVWPFAALNYPLLGDVNFEP